MPFDSSPDHAKLLDFLYGRLDYERSPRAVQRRWRFKLDRMRQLLERLGDPQTGLPIVHVAGTKGKGSTASMIAAVLSQAGYQTGLYTSPHLECLEQRMQIDGACCTRDELHDLLADVKPVVEAMDVEAPGQGPTFFEVTTAMALLHFRRRNVGAVVLEVGLGGRLDSTNVCQPCVSVITSISFDHMAQLGNTLAAIAGEKAGIIKPKIPVVSGVVPSEPRDVIQQVARQQQSPLLQLGEDFDFEYRSPDRAILADTSPGGQIDFRQRAESGVGAGGDLILERLQLGLFGRHQAANAAVAVATLIELQRQGWAIADDALRAGLTAARCPARIELIGRQPATIVDTAHNVASVAALVETLDECFARGNRLLVFATSKDKDAEGMLRALLPAFDRVIFTRVSDNARAADPQELCEIARHVSSAEPQLKGKQNQFTYCPDPHEAWQNALASSNEASLICVAGSFFLAAELRSVVLAAKNSESSGRTVLLPTAT